MRYYKPVWLAVALVLLCLVSGQVVLALPPRPDQLTPTPTLGGAIELHIEGFRAGLWAVVQWQDGLGNWHDVEGWRGEPADERVIWWVAPKDFGTGPFRWAIYDGAAGDLLVACDPFYLPDWHGQVVRAAVSVP